MTNLNLTNAELSMIGEIINKNIFFFEDVYNKNSTKVAIAEFSKILNDVLKFKHDESKVMQEHILNLKQISEKIKNSRDEVQNAN